MATYIGLIHKEAGSDYGVSFPDLPGCATAGTDLDDARRMAAEALALHIEGLIEDGDAIPEPSTLEVIMADPENRDGVAVLVDSPQAPARVVRINVTMDERLVEQIDRAAGNRSRFLAEAAREKLQHA